MGFLEPSRLYQPCMSTKGSLNKIMDEDLNFYTENSTNLIYEAKFFEDFVIVRPCSPVFQNALRQMSWADFSDEFHECLAPRGPIIEALYGHGEDDDEGGEKRDVELR